MIPDEAESLSRNGCLGCHSVESMGAVGGDIGPDLSRAFPEMKGKHGKELDDFLKDPTSAVMATVIADDPLNDEDRKSTRLNSSHVAISYAVFCLKKKKHQTNR